MTLLIAWFCIYGFNLSGLWCVISFVIWLIHLGIK